MVSSFEPQVKPLANNGVYHVLESGTQGWAACIYLLMFPRPVILLDKKGGAVVGGWAGTPETYTSPLTSCLVAAPTPAEGTCTAHGAKITRGREPGRAVRTVAPPGTTGRNQVKPQVGEPCGF